MPDIFPVILSGGSGTRLWPLSRGLYPKQFVDFGGSTLFGDSLDRVLSMDKLAAPIVICNQEHRFLAADLMRQKGLLSGAGDVSPEKALPRIILEPVGRNTAPAIALAALAARDACPDSLILVLPSDHRIEPLEDFAACVRLAERAAIRDRLLTFGVHPDRAATGYGYIIYGQEEEGVYPVSSFVEKPDEDQALALLRQGKCFWNSGMFLFKAGLYLEELRRLAPEVYKSSLAAWAGRKTDLDFIRIDPELFAAIPSISVDYAVMEHTKLAWVVPLTASWHDLGSWEAMHEITPKDENGNGVLGDAMLLDAKNSYVYASSRLVAGIGLRDMMVVESPDAVLVMRQGRGQEVKKLLDVLKTRKRTEAETHLRTYRPWGSYEILAREQRFQVKRILVKCGSALSLQMHHHRAEHWVVVRGTAKVRLEDQDIFLTENQSVYIPVGNKHRLENPGLMDLELIEIQSGAYLDEDDIVRFEDRYGR
ncbi:MAG: mannose-1-phosphate guanylyltransferase/mannose-6-phosphate isomerase [Desulfovibrionaceae bacterium]|nr:mannose-1-phosphate guanylyltransferase/mannose-6-phosphate isomerase [Desulfovibrionaceae bacterium]